MTHSRSRFAPLLLLLSGLAVAAPDEELLGKSRGYPIGTRGNWYFDETVRVGAFSNLATLLPHHVLPRAATPPPLKRAVAGHRGIAGTLIL